jgi:hypothetical protein
VSPGSARRRCIASRASVREGRNRIITSIHAHHCSNTPYILTTFISMFGMRRFGNTAAERCSVCSFCRTHCLQCYRQCGSDHLGISLSTPFPPPHTHTHTHKHRPCPFTNPINPRARNRSTRAYTHTLTHAHTHARTTHVHARPHARARGPMCVCTHARAHLVLDPHHTSLSIPPSFA